MTQVNLLAIRDSVIARAVNDRKIAADRADDYKRMYDANPNGMFNLLIAPVAQGGLVAGMNMGGDPFPVRPTDYPKEWLGQEQRHAPVTFEDQYTAVEAAVFEPQPPPDHSPRHPAPSVPAGQPVKPGTVVICND